MLNLGKTVEHMVGGILVSWQDTWGQLLIRNFTLRKIGGVIQIGVICELNFQAGIKLGWIFSVK
ncbi:MAG: hypothetical protein Q4E41_03110 [Bacteroidales bacterium]|nr:hypothetical protein [Bacteroidales bacterium]